MLIFNDNQDLCLSYDKLLIGQGISQYYKFDISNKKAVGTKLEATAIFFTVINVQINIQTIYLKMSCSTKNILFNFVRN